MENNFEILKKRIKVRFKNMPVNWEELKTLVKRDLEFEKNKNQIVY